MRDRRLRLSRKKGPCVAQPLCVCDCFGPGPTNFLGKVWTLRYQNGVASDFTDITSQLFPTRVGGYTLNALTSLGEDANGEIYLVDEDVAGGTGIGKCLQDCSGPVASLLSLPCGSIFRSGRRWLECIGIGESQTSFRSLRDAAQLLHHPEQIPADPLLYNFVFLYAVDDNTHPTRLPVGWL